MPKFFSIGDALLVYVEDRCCEPLMPKNKYPKAAKKLGRDPGVLEVSIETRDSGSEKTRFFYEIFGVVKEIRTAMLHNFARFGRIRFGR